MISKITTGWVQSVNGKMLTDSFADAWSTLLNGLAGTWGAFEYQLLNVQNTLTTVSKSTVYVSRDLYKTTLDTTISGEVILTLPFSSQGITSVIVSSLTGDEVTSSSTYIIDEGTNTKTLTLTTGRKLITIEGIVRRI